MNRGKVNVVLRVKPLDDGQVSDKVTVVDSEMSGASVILKKSNKTEDFFQYRFYRALENSTQELTYQVCGEEVIKSCLEGYNGTIIAYGQTGSGKTHTMFGPDGISLQDVDFHGIMPRAIEQVFTAIERYLEWKVKMTYVEVYNETFRDLLTNSRKPISVLDSTTKSRGSTSLKGCAPTLLKSKSHAFNLLLKGQESRMVAAHAMNDRSSRSHAIVTLWIEITEDDGRTVKSKLNMVDLAGSERVRKTGTTGTLAKEATYINKSLSCLSLVAKELRRKALHIHYRDSKLTHYLKDSIGGNCRTLMIACVWGDASNFGETLSTCRFADDVQNVEVTASKNSGIESVHGNLFKMNPAMTKYIEQMMEKRVAQEKAKMFRSLKKRGLLTAELEDMDSCSVEDGSMKSRLNEAEASELEILRNKVKALEQSKKSQVSEETQESSSTAPELEALRQTVEKLEAEKKQVQEEMSKQMKEAESSLLDEIQDLRSKVNDMQKLRALTHQECMELCALHDRTVEVAGRSLTPMLDPVNNNDLKSQGPVFHPDLPPRKMDISVQVVNEASSLGTQRCWETVEKQARVVGELEGLRNRLKQLHDVAMEKLSNESVDELTQIQNKIINFQNDQALKNAPLGFAQQEETANDDRNALQELEFMKRRLVTLHSLPVDELKYDDLQELAHIKNKVSSLQNNGKVRSALQTREAEKSRFGGSEVLNGYIEEETPPAMFHPHGQKLSISSEFTSSINVESPSNVFAFSPMLEPTQKPAAPLRIRSVPHDCRSVGGVSDETSSDSVVQHQVSPPRRLSIQSSTIPPFPEAEFMKLGFPHSTANSVTPHKRRTPSISSTTTRLRRASMKSIGRRKSGHFWKLVGNFETEKGKNQSETQVAGSLDESGNPAILNALNHDQLLEILRFRYTSHPSLGSALLSDHSFDSKHHI